MRMLVIHSSSRLAEQNPISQLHNRRARSNDLFIDYICPMDMKLVSAPVHL